LFVGQRASIPEQVPQTTIEAFQRDGHPLPAREKILLDWTSSLVKSDWNKMAIGFLAEMFIEELVDYPSVKADPAKINVTSISKKIQQTLIPTWKRAHEQRVAADTMDEKLRTYIQQKPILNLTRRRRYGRREGVCVQSFCSVHQTHVGCRPTSDALQLLNLIAIPIQRHGPASNKSSTILISTE
jgi:hypothetical protein